MNSNTMNSFKYLAPFGREKEFKIWIKIGFLNFKKKPFWIHPDLVSGHKQDLINRDPLHEPDAAETEERWRRDGDRLHVRLLHPTKRRRRTGVNFINILLSNFLNKSVFRSFSLITASLCNFLAKEYWRKIFS